jgi:hypothetical protein
MLPQDLQLHPSHCSLPAGTLGFLTVAYGDLVWGPQNNIWGYTAGAVLISTLAVYASYKLDLDTSAKLACITYLLVTFSSYDDDRECLHATACTPLLGLLATACTPLPCLHDTACTPLLGLLATAGLCLR